MKKIILLFCLVWASICYAADYTEIDAYALTAPPVSSTTTLKRAVNYLTKPYKTDHEKARVLLAWLVYNFDYDTFQYKEMIKSVKRGTSLSLPDNDVLKTHIGVCGDFAQLYADMLKMVDIKSKYIDGYAGQNITRKNADEYVHAWVYAKVDKKDVFIDPTLAMTGGRKMEEITTKAQYRADLKNRKHDKQKSADSSKIIDNKWFLVTPKEMIKTHFPKNQEDQFLTSKVSWHKFLKEQSKTQQKESPQEKQTQGQQNNSPKLLSKETKQVVTKEQPKEAQKQKTTEQLKEQQKEQKNE